MDPLGHALVIRVDTSNLTNVEDDPLVLHG